MPGITDKLQRVQASVLHGAKDLRCVRRHCMPCIRYHKADAIKQETRDLASPLSSQLQVSVGATGLCGSDLHYFNHHRNGDIIVKEPMSLGHESAGIVTAVGHEAASKFRVGDRVALEVGIPCTACERCSEGRYNICKAMSFRSSAKSFPHFQGTLQERINHPAEWCHK